MRTSFQTFFSNLIGFGLEYFGLFYSCYYGTVADNADPEMLGRLKVNCADLYGEDIPNYWAWPKVSFAGNQIGLFAIPEIGDAIYVECKNGNPKYPLWSGGYWAKPGAVSEVPETARLLPPTNRVLQSKSGHRIELDDTSGAEKIKITDKSGNYILIDSTTKNEEHFVQADKIDLIAANKIENIGANKTEIIAGNKTSNVTGNKNETIIGHQTSNVILGKTEQIGLQWNITVIGNASITAPLISLNGKLACITGGGASAKIETPDFEISDGSIKLGSHSAMLKLLTEAFATLFNSHTHPGCGGSSNSGAPNEQAGASHQTSNTEAS